MYKKYYKRLFDIFFCILTSPIWLIFFFFIFFFLYLINYKPIFYKGDRIGKKNKKFKILKFRTLKTGSGKENIGDTVKHKDVRLTKIGYILRKFKLDEIPQFFQIIVGEMSIVGPRPELPIYVNKNFYKKHKISDLRPGLTDYSSIYFINLQKKIPKRNTKKFVENFILKKKNFFKKKYSNDVSFFTDLKIIYLTCIKLCTVK